MKTSAILFYTIFFTLYALLNYYIFIRGWQAIPHGSAWRVPYVILFLLASLSYLAARSIEHYTVCTASNILFWIGSFWFGYMLYLILPIVLLDIARGANSLVHFFPDSVTENYARVKAIAGISIFALATITLFIGYVNAKNPRVQTLDIALQKPLAVPSLKIVFVSDVHLGNIIGNGELTKLVETINGFNPDLVIFGGDLVDEDIKPVIGRKMGDVLLTLRARYGVFAITGNHEYIGGAEPAVRWMREHGITVLRDSSATIDGMLQLVGRDDRSRKFFAAQDRKKIDELLAGVDRALPTIVLDHDPTELESNCVEGVDLVMSGHTHHGQLFPLNFITNRIYLVSWGSRLVGSTHAYVSCGFGTWGPPTRLGNRPEIVVVNLHSILNQ